MNNTNAIEPFSWGYRDGYALRFAPYENGCGRRWREACQQCAGSADLARQNSDGSPDYHGWPDRYGFLPASQAVFNPTGGPAEDLCVFDATNPPSNCTAASLAQILNAADAALVQIPGTGVIWKICPQ